VDLPHLMGRKGLQVQIIQKHPTPLANLRDHQINLLRQVFLVDLPHLMGHKGLQVQTIQKHLTPLANLKDHQINLLRQVFLVDFPHRTGLMGLQVQTIQRNLIPLENLKDHQEEQPQCHCTQLLQLRRLINPFHIHRDAQTTVTTNVHGRTITST